MRRSMLVLALTAVLALFGGGLAFAQGQAPPGSWSAADCLTCHDKAGNPAFEHSKHATLAQSCASCHKNVAEHAKAQMAGEKGGPVPTFKGKTSHEVNAVCLSCHEKDAQSSWATSMHDRRNVACTDCHSVHAFKSVKGQLKTMRDPDTCYTCHKAERAKSLRTSHHPVREGKLGCSSCHNPHEGNRPKMIRADSVNELCYTCHAEKRGPFAFEHAPVREDCVSCHDPHGSNHPRLLIQKVPNLCWNCHFQGGGHYSTTGDNLSTEKGRPTAPTGAPTTFPTVNSRYIERGCRNCHVAVHGTNHPSGAALLR